MEADNSNIFFTLISPVHNEEDTVIELVERSIAALNECGAIKGNKWEYILVDDASTDNTPEMISKAMAEYPDVVIGVRHKRHMGQGQALRTGFFLGRGKIFSTLDSDLEKMPEDTSRLLQVFLEKQCDIVCSYIKKKNLASKIGNGLLRALFSHKVQQASTNQMVIAARFVKNVNLIKNDQRYVVPISMSLGASKIEEVETSYIPRRYGASKYNIFKKIIQGFPEMLELKKRINKKFYHRLLNDDYRDCFYFIQPNSKKVELYEYSRSQ